MVSEQRTIHIIDDDEHLLDAFALLLRTEGFAVVTYASAEIFLAQINRESRGCVVTDVRMAGMSGMDLLTAMKERGLALPTIVVTGHADIPLAVQAMKRGAADLLEKPVRAEDLIHAIEQVLAAVETTPPSAANVKFSQLSKREKQVLEEMLLGRPNKTIAFNLGISQRTVEIHRARVMRKTGAGSLAELVKMSLSAKVE